LRRSSPDRAGPFDRASLTPQRQPAPEAVVYRAFGQPAEHLQEVAERELPLGAVQNHQVCSVERS
jgi:hypothetical protein